ncbi:MAG TPA: CapA family protein [Candidatus Acidoferrales bacterium]|nr:CapA family protein [Candidatus Acidoferrales bacterium]
MRGRAVFEEGPPRRKVTGRRALAFFAILLSLFILRWGHAAASGRASTVPSYPREISRVSFAAAGDVIPHQAVVKSAALHDLSIKENRAVLPREPKDAATPAPPSMESNHAGWDDLFAGVADVFRQADFGFVNLETPVAPAHSKGSRPFQFDAPIALLESLKSNGIKVVSFANNHVFDQGHAGFGETLEHLRDGGILFAGAGSSAENAWKPVIIEKNGIKVGLLGMTRWLNGNRNPEKDTDPHVAFFPYPGESLGAPGLDAPAVLEKIKAARSQCDLLLISIHWGTEYAPAPHPEDVELAHSFLEAGASAVLGHHPHVLQPVETYLTQDSRSTVIFYSLGNFLSNQSRQYIGGLMPDKAGEPRDSLVVKFSVVKKDYGPAGARFELADVGIIPAWTENNHHLVASKKAKTLFIGPVFLDREIPRLQAKFDELNHLGTPLSPEQKKELIEVSGELQMLKHRRELLLARTGDEYLIAPPNP